MSMSDDEIALKLMRLYKQLQSAQDPDLRRRVCDTIDHLVAQLKLAAPAEPPPPVAPRPIGRRSPD
jgi:hypothetical protein